MGITNYETNYKAATTAFYEGFEQLFNRERAPMYAMLCDEQTVVGKTLEAPFLGDHSPVRKWLGSKRFQDIRSFRDSYPVEPYEKSLRLRAFDLRHDSTGAIGRKIGAFLRETVGYFDAPVFDMLQSNPVGFDGVGLISTSHPFGPSGNQSNSTSDALSHASFRAGIATMKSWKSEFGKPLDINPTHLIVGPDLEATALEVAGIDKPVNVSNAGALDATSNVVGVTAIRNVYEGRTSVVVSPRILAGRWFIADLSKPMMRPLVLGVARAPEPIVVDDPASDARFQRDEWLASIEADFALGAGLWPTIFGKNA